MGRWPRVPNPGVGALPTKVGVSRGGSCGSGPVQMLAGQSFRQVVGERCLNIGAGTLSRSGYL